MVLEKRKVQLVSSLTKNFETRIKKKLSTFSAFIDFKRAYDTSIRNII